MTQDIGSNNLRKLTIYFYEEKWVHFKDKDGIFYNGYILYLDKENLSMIFKERIKGEISILLECIKTDSIQSFRLTKRKEDDTRHT